MSGGVAAAWIYDRIIAVYRPVDENDVGDTGDYGGVDKAKEVLVMANIPCHIQHASTGAPNESNLPGGARTRARYRFHIPLGVVPFGTIKAAYVIVDDEEVRYLVNAPWRHALGYRIEADMMLV